MPFYIMNSSLFIFRNINAFLNTGKGGTVYLGIIDNGTVKGLRMSQYQVINNFFQC